MCNIKMCELNSDNMSSSGEVTNKSVVTSFFTHSVRKLCNGRRNRDNIVTVMQYRFVFTYLSTLAHLYYWAASQH